MGKKHSLTLVAGGDTFELRDAVAAQDALQIKAYGGVSPTDLDPEAKIEFIRWNMLALEDELHEALGEVGWKPWATSRHINTEAFKGELVDALHFFMNLLLVADITADELLEAYQKKREKNIKRQEAGYDGVTEKCPHCKRALDDDAVECREDTLHPGVFICAEGEPR